MFSRSVEGKVRSPLTARANATEQNARFAWRRQARAVEDGEDGSDTGVRTHLIANPRWHGYDQRAARSDPDELYFPKIAAAYGVLGQPPFSAHSVRENLALSVPPNYPIPGGFSWASARETYIV